jgi:hypothetical protein
MDTQNNISDENSGFYLISLKWSNAQEKYITFVRKGALAYCYNINWAGPMSKFEADRFKRGNTIVVHQSLIKPLIIAVNDDMCKGYALPNTEETRKVIGFKDVSLHQAI